MSNLVHMFTGVIDYQPIREFFQKIEKKKETPINNQTNFIETYSNNLIKFVYNSIPTITEQFSENNLYRFDIIKNRTFTTNIYDVICYDTRQIIMYFVEHKNIFKKEKIYDIFLNYNFNFPISNVLYPEIISQIYSFLPRQFNKKHKNGYYIGSIITDWHYNYFKLNLDESQLFNKNSKFNSKNIYSAKQYPYPNPILFEVSLPQIKKTKIFFQENNTKLFKLGNIRPIWDNILQIYTLPVYGRIKHTSDQNTVFVDKNEEIFVIFGCLEFKDEYTLDFKHPISLIQAISIAITCLNK